MLGSFPPPANTNSPIFHVGFAVPDIPAAVERWVRVMGAGPFYLIEHMMFDFSYYRGEPCQFDHSAAFGQCGPIAVELQKIHSSSHAGLTATLENGGALNHVSYMSATPAAESARLETLGMPGWLHLGAGELEVWFHDARPTLGYSIEIHRRCNFIEAFFANLAKEAAVWNGTDPLRLVRPDIVAAR